MKRIVIVGGGIVGLATAYRLLQRDGGLQLHILEKEDSIAQHQSSHNSGVLHCGLDYRPGSRRARLSVEGVRQMVAFCEEHGIRYELCGKAVVATSPEELPRLHQLMERGVANGLRGLRLMDLVELREIEPHCAGLASGPTAIHVPEEGIADYPAVAAKLRDWIEHAGATVECGAQVHSVTADGSNWRVVHAKGETSCDFVIGCAGLYSDRIAKLCGAHAALQEADTAARPIGTEVRIVPFRGEYYMIRPERQFLVRNLIYPVPDPRFPFLGVHFTRRITGGIEAGPNAVLALSREGYTKRDLRLGDVADAVFYPGLLRFLVKYARPAWEELQRSFSRTLFCASLRRLVPELQESDLAPGGSGVRAQAMGRDGLLVDDFHFLERPGQLHVINAPSPAATSSLAIGTEIADRVLKQIKE